MTDSSSQPGGHADATAAHRLMTAADVRALDAAAENAGVSGRALMERAGAAVARAALRRHPDAGRIEIWAGPGKNGGDGWVAARHLRIAGRNVAVRSVGAPDALQGDARWAFNAWTSIGGGWAPFAPSDSSTADLIIDALFGVGLSRPIDGVVAAAIEDLGTGSAPPVLAVDIPSGIDADTGRRLGAAIAADTTVTFVRPKRGLFLGDGAAMAGDIVVADILDGLPQRDAALAAASRDVVEIRPESFGAARLAKESWPAHKYTHGHAVVASGGFGATGAARLAATAALRAGAGLTTVAAPGNALAECAAQLTAVMLRRADTPDDLLKTLSDDRISAAVVGPGHASHPGGPSRTAAAVSALLEASAARTDRGLAVVLDADALSCWGDAPERLFDNVRRTDRIVMTPHFGEFSRLFPDLAKRLSNADAVSAFGKIDAARAAAMRSGAVVLLKGADTVVAAPDARVGVHAAFGARAAPWLATAGAGDVLAGIVGGLCARGWPAYEAASAAAWLHVEAARCVGPGMIAEDLAAALPTAIGRALETCSAPPPTR